MRHAIVVCCFVAVAAPAYADSDSMMKDVEHICLRPSDVKSHLRVEADGKAEGGVIIRLLGLQMGASAHFTKEEWDGVQAALPPKDVAADSQSYRNCTELLMPLFMSKYKESSQPANDEHNIEPGRREIHVIGPHNTTTYIEHSSGSTVTNTTSK
jgi:hypothetical protein